MIKFLKIDETYCRLVAEDYIILELSEHFMFQADGYQWTPAYKKGWDGYTRLLSSATGKFYTGLLKSVILKCKELGYNDFSFEGFKSSGIEYTEDAILESIERFNLPVDRLPREHQLNAVLTSLMGNRRICLSATNSGKSLVQYIISRMFIESGKKVLIVVPSVMLVNQMYTDYESYSIDGKFEIEEYYHKIYEGQKKNSDKDCYISTWQSLMAMSSNSKSKAKGDLDAYLEQFDAVIVDEVHLAEAKSLKTIMEKSINAKFKLGFTGTLKDCKTHILVLTGLFGTVKNIITTKQLIDLGYAAKIKIKCIILNYPEEIRELVSLMDYDQELDTIIGYDKRNQFIANLANKLEGNTLTLVRFIEKHALGLKDRFDAKENKKTYLLTGDTDKDEKLFVKSHMEDVTNTNLMGSYQLLSTGISIINLNNAIFASPSKSKIKILQSIGRMLRKGKNKHEATVYDIVDNLTYDKKYNFLMRHFKERYHQYINEEFPVEIIEINIG